MELLVVLAIIGILVALLVPAVQGARESARLVSCQNNLKQIALACLNYEQTHRRLPGYAGERAPYFVDFGPKRKRSVALTRANWISQSMPFLEQTSLFKESGDLNSRWIETPDESIRQAVQVAIPALYCPSRRNAKAYPLDASYGKRYGPTASRTDYALSGGAATVSKEDHRLIENMREGVWKFGELTRLQDVRDGTSQTYLVGEKAMDTLRYDTGMDFGDRSPIQGWNEVRPTTHSYVRYAARPPQQDIPNNCKSCHDFGSAHVAGWNVARVDGSVHLNSYFMDLQIHRAMASIHGKEVFGNRQ